MLKSLYAVLAVLTLGAAAATAETIPGQQPLDSSPQVGGANQLDSGIAACLAFGNQEEIAIAQFAEAKVKHDKVREFVAMILKDHREALNRLQQIAPQTAALKLGADAQSRPTDLAALTTPGQPGAPAHGVDAQMVALQRRVAEKCLELTRRELNEYEGDEFDMAFVGQQCGAHVAMLAKLEATGEFASPQLRDFIEESTKVVERHLAQLKEIKKNLKESSGDDRASAQRDDDSARR